jgi:acyl-CoA oxidase
MDNAYMLFDNFRIPHSAFLSRYAKVDPSTSAYSKPSNPAVVYGSLTYVRANIVMHARLVLARAVTVAVRYLSIRHQFPSRDNPSPNGPEEAVLNYPTVQIRILPLLATTFALHYTGAAMSALYKSTRQDISRGDFTALVDLHSTSGLKSLCTTLAADGIETCRRAMGGHGFGGGSGLIQLNADYLSKPTVEGDNWMITQQTASHLLKKVSTALASPSPTPHDTPTDTALKEFLQARTHPDNPKTFDIPHCPRALALAFRFRAAYLAVRAHDARVAQRRSWNGMLVQLHALGIAHAQAVLVENFYAALYGPLCGSAGVGAGEGREREREGVPGGAREVMGKVFRLFGLSMLVGGSGAGGVLGADVLSFLGSGCVSVGQVDGVAGVVGELMREIRPHAVKLVDAWCLPDYLLDSALGRYDGRVYEELFERASSVERNPLNAETFNPWFWDEEVVLGSGRGWDGQLLADGEVGLKAKL